jgi:signal transduction histidine kinase
LNYIFVNYFNDIVIVGPIPACYNQREVVRMNFSDFLYQILNLLTSNSGSLVYHLILVAWIFGSFQVVFYQTRQNPSHIGKRVLTGLGILLATRILLILSTGIFSQSSTILPPIDRALNAITLLWILWIYAFPDAKKGVDVATIALSVAIVTTGIINAVYLESINGIDPFNSSWFDIGWIAFMMVTILGSELILLTRQMSGWVNGLMLIAIHFVGLLTHIILINNFEGNYISLLRVAQLVAFPLLFTLPQNLPKPQPEPIDQPIKTEEQPIQQSQFPLTSISPKHLLDVLALSSEYDTSNLCKQLAKVLAQSLIADVCLLVMGGEGSNVVVQCGYDLISENFIKGTAIKNQLLPQLSSAIKRQSYLMLPPGDDSKDFPNLAEFLRVKTVGGMLAVPLRSNSSDFNITVLLLSPHSKRTWKEADRKYINEISPTLINILENAQESLPLNLEVERLRIDLEQAEQRYQELLAEFEAEPQPEQYKDDYIVLSVEHEVLKEKIQGLETENSELLTKIEGLKASHQSATALVEELTTLKAEKEELLTTIASLQSKQEDTEKISDLEEEIEKIKSQKIELEANLEKQEKTLNELNLDHQKSQSQLQEYQDKINLLQKENELLKSNAKTVHPEADTKKSKIKSIHPENDTKKSEIKTVHPEDEYRAALAEIANLESELALKKERISELESQNQSVNFLAEQNDIITSLSQDLRQPMSSIMGYTDLLLSESVGILGALQRKFLERIKSSTDRMSALLGDLLQVTTLDTGEVDISAECVDLSSIIDESINATSNQLREKNIILRVDLPEELPKIHTDKDGLHQILLSLLQNAGATTPAEGEITLRALVENANGVSDDHILVQVADSGGGIPEEEVNRVFSRLYRADNPLIQGVGDTGVGLSIAKTLTEALGGRIWVESEMGLGATFSILIPINNKTNDK